VHFNRPRPLLFLFIPLKEDKDEQEKEHDLWVEALAQQIEIRLKSALRGRCAFARLRFTTHFQLCTKLPPHKLLE
jgi:hypothetical protein